ncbi:amidophosphoribosyltransferase [Hominifimenecus sp. rT4P-3]|uniref:amidophosphoribosyltransferase n=1 Tax=Hominifimenecus sp. rT4P-3 TaxID=3242979 RepID=UPI003DA44ABD
MEEFWDKLKEECGVFGVYQLKDAASTTYLGLHALQHRGQEGAGIASSDGKKLYCRKGKGLLTEALSSEDLLPLAGCHSIGHVRYATAGGDEVENIQPIVARASFGSLAVAHNGQIVNAGELRVMLERRGHLFLGSSDSEIILHLIQMEEGPLVAKICRACAKLKGAFAFLFLTEKSIYAVRDRNGLRPLCLGKKGDGYVLSSETCAFDSVGASWVRDIEPGEVLKISSHGVQSFRYAEAGKHCTCAMEYIYFARPDSVMDGRNIYHMRKETGKILARADAGQIEADLVAGVPDSSLSAALGYAEASGIPYEVALIKNRYVGRTFIEPTQEQRDLGVKRKLAVNRYAIEGKRLILLDDSVVRGTTSKRIIRLLKEAGAKEVHLRIASPEIRFPCFYGIDTPTQEELIAAQMNVDELCQFLGADSLRFLSTKDLMEAYGGEEFCFACFDGVYPAGK